MNLWTWKDGTQSIFEHLNDKLKNHARLNSDITKVARRDGKVYVTVNGREEEYDKLIVTAPLQYFPDYADASEQEKDLFSRIDYERYDVLSFLTKPEDHPKTSYYIFDNMFLTGAISSLFSGLSSISGKLSTALNRSPSTVRRIVPFCSSVRLSAMDRPRPLPSVLRELSPRTKRPISSSAEIFRGSLEVFLKETSAWPSCAARSR